jgi:hypothetical protein
MLALCTRFSQHPVQSGSVAELGRRKISSAYSRSGPSALRPDRTLYGSPGIASTRIHDLLSQAREVLSTCHVTGSDTCGKLFSRSQKWRRQTERSPINAIAVAARTSWRCRFSTIRRLGQIHKDSRVSRTPHSEPHHRNPEATGFHFSSSALPSCSSCVSHWLITLRPNTHRHSSTRSAACL